MKVAIHADALSHVVPGGVGAYVANLLEALKRRSNGEYRLILSRDSPAPEGWSDSQIDRAALPLRAGYFAWNFLRLPRVSSEAQVIHAPGFVIPTVTQPVVATIHDITPLMFADTLPTIWAKLYLRGIRLARKAASVTCVPSAAVAGSLREYFDFPEEKLVVTPLAPTITPQTQQVPQALERLGVKQPFILNVSTVEPRKNQLGLVKAFEAISHRLPHHQLVIAGPLGWGHQPLTEAVNSSRFKTRIVITGRLDAGELATLYSRADFFVLPSFYEGFGIPLVEALSFGAACIATDIPALRELGGDDVLYVPTSGTDDLAEALVTVGTDEFLKKRLSSAGPSRASTYTWDKTAEATEAAYKQALT